jgi:hypothetical protein
MLPAVDLDDEPPFAANEIGDVRTDGLLSNELVPADRTCA